MSSSSLHGVKSPAISHPLDFDDQAAHGARNGQVAKEPRPRTVRNLMGFYTMLKSSDVMLLSLFRELRNASNFLCESPICLEAFIQVPN